jgi:hypothetical protein
VVQRIESVEKIDITGGANMVHDRCRACANNRGLCVKKLSTILKRGKLT